MFYTNYKTEMIRLLFIICKKILQWNKLLYFNTIHSNVYSCIKLLNKGFQRKFLHYLDDLTNAGIKTACVIGYVLSQLSK